MYSLSGIAAPDEARFASRYAEIAGGLERTDSAVGWRAGFDEWDGLRRDWQSWANLTRLRYSQDTRRDEYREAQCELDRRTPAVSALDTAMKRRFLASPKRAALERELGPHAFALWEADVTTFEPAIAADLIRESALAREYTELLACATVTFDGEERSLGSLGPYLQDARRQTRHRAESARWSAFAARAEQLDAIFDELVRLRDGMARRLGYASYTALGYRRMRRVDYDANDVATYRDEVARVVVPFATDLVRRLGSEAGYERTYFWDESALGVAKQVVPLGDCAWILQRTAEALAAIDPELGAFIQVMLEGELLDVDNRPGKALGAYCTTFPTRRVPFVFANFNGSRSDVRTIMHELGHAFQSWKSRDKAAIDYVTPTFESAEIHSMSLEYLSWPHMERFFAGDAPAYRREHLLDAMLFLPYGVAVDHFQHLVYAHPGATSAERNAMWQEVERRYLPWRDYGDLAHPKMGGLWQEKRHIYVAPFYYIDYTLALCCALQLWVASESDRAQTLARYVALCARGGEAPFRALVESAGLRSPFEPGTLADVVTAASVRF
ncbi:MAG: M3 family oligoendopeptidase [Candidatus Eremiobacteraeota bacterium]|nr:M3 family oligoendopeptidase [Candidatus Eremiobacteraeota bacterium]